MSSNEAGNLRGPAASIPQTPTASMQGLAAQPHIAHLHDALAGITSQMGHDALTLMDDDDLLSVTQHLEQASRRINALLIAAAGNIDHRSEPHLENSLAKRKGCRNTTELLQRLSQHSSATIGRRLKVARATRRDIGFTGSTIPPQFPAVADALAAGDLPEETALQIVKSLAGLPSRVDPTKVEIAERGIVDQAAGYSSAERFDGLSPDDQGPGNEGPDDEGPDDEGPDDEGLDPAGHAAAPLPVDCDTIKLICQTWSTFLDQDGTAPNEESAMRERYLWLGPEKNGLVPLHGLLLPEAAALLGSLFNAVNSPRTAANTNAMGAGTGTDAGPGSATGSGAATGAGAHAARAGGSGRKVEFVQCDDDPSTEGGPSTEDHSPALPEADPRSYGQKMHDAFKIVAEIAARAAETPQVGGAPVTVLIQTTQQELAASINSDNGSGGNSDTGKSGTAWIHGHDGRPTPTSMATVRQCICAGTTQRVITGPAAKSLASTAPPAFSPHTNDEPSPRETVAASFPGAASRQHGAKCITSLNGPTVAPPPLTTVS
ncbi:hypothetical protein JOF28_000639 [Leucobacter exalbidus]|uniref:DUF222 domain-containing protein n=1 Tax=Leucobacter exalbidus TaxID=662960 RepID=A0A940PRL4_9MICO|nr:DUF222 domain-containing protein [Leucobacter exalbidus]MBP1325407.1 hypothetical protein [Leucobacter exalbidus]